MGLMLLMGQDWETVEVQVQRPPSCPSMRQVPLFEYNLKEMHQALDITLDWFHLCWATSTLLNNEGTKSNPFAALIL